MFIYIYIHIHTHTCIRNYVLTNTKWCRNILHYTCTLIFLCVHYRRRERELQQLVDNARLQVMYPCTCNLHVQHANVHIYMYNETCIHMCTYIYTYICKHMYIYVYIHIYIYVYTYMYIYIYIHTHTHIYVNVCMYVCIHTYIYTYIHIYV